jgi:hypothetical protein
MTPLVVDGSLTWYDARANHPTRTECRLYYPSNPVLDAAAEGDYMLLALTAGDALATDAVVVVSPGTSTVAVQLQSVFGLEPGALLDVEVLPGDEELSFASRVLLEALGIDAVATQEDWLERLLGEFGENFPGTDRFSAFARASIPEVDGRQDPDEALVAWMDQEESLYRTFERHLVGRRLAGTQGDVDLTLEIAMQTFQRRRSRAGHALENHVAQLLGDHHVAFSRQGTTEGRKRPDFLFPGQAEYRDLRYPADRLYMLGVKTTCKDRWRQVLTEADRVETKHLLTLEAPISPAQTGEMRTRLLRLVVPRPLHPAFEPAQQGELMSLHDFIGFVKSEQEVSLL